jgi:predicted transcriptional regulator
MTDAERLLTDAELELMRILWELDEGTVRDLMAALPTDRPLAYTTVSTIVRILEKKGFVESRKEGRTHHYRPLIERPRYEARTLRHVLGSLFGGSPTALVRRLVSEQALSGDELRALLDTDE